MFSQHPKMARKWADEQKAEGKSFKTMPKRVKGSKATPAKTKAQAAKYAKKKK